MIERNAIHQNFVFGAGMRLYVDCFCGKSYAALFSSSFICANFYTLLFSLLDSLSFNCQMRNNANFFIANRLIAIYSLANVSLSISNKTTDYLIDVINTCVVWILYILACSSYTTHVNYEFVAISNRMSYMFISMFVTDVFMCAQHFVLSDLINRKRMCRLVFIIFSLFHSAHFFFFSVVGDQKNIKMIPN